jgi:hypothetical protein
MDSSPGVVHALAYGRSSSGSGQQHRTHRGPHRVFPIHETVSVRSPALELERPSTSAQDRSPQHAEQGVVTPFEPSGLSILQMNLTTSNETVHCALPRFSTRDSSRIFCNLCWSWYAKRYAQIIVGISIPYANNPNTQQGSKVGSVVRKKWRSSAGS